MCAQATGRLWRHGRCLTIRARNTWYISMILSPLMYAYNSFLPSLSKTLLSGVGKEAKSGIRAVFRVKRHVLYSGVLRAFQAHCCLHFYYLHKLYRAWHQPRPSDQAVASPLLPWSVWAEINSICRCNSLEYVTTIRQEHP